MRIAQVCRVGAPHVGGMERVVAGLSRALIRRGHDVVAFTLDEAPTTGEPLRDGVVDGVPYRRLPRIGPRRYPFARGLADAVRGFDLVHVHGLDGLADVLVEARPAPIGVSTHGGYFHTPRHRWLKALALRTRTRRTLRRADAVWFTSEADRARLAPARVAGIVLPDGVDVDRFAGIPRRPIPGRWVVFGRVDVHKGVDDVIRALRHADGHVDVVGPEARPGLIDELRALARQEGVADRVTFWGALADDALRDRLAVAELALFPSRSEGFGLAVVELMAAGVPPVVSPIPAHDALVTPDLDGYRAPWADPPAAARFLEGLRGRDHDRIAAAAVGSARRHGWDAAVDRHEAAYAEVIACASR